MKTTFLTFLSLALVWCGRPEITRAADEVSAQAFKRPDGTLGVDELAAFLACRQGKGVSDVPVPAAQNMRVVVTTNDKGQQVQKVFIVGPNLIAEVEDELNQLTNKLARAGFQPPSWPWSEVDKIYAKEEPPKVKWTEIKGVTTAWTLGKNPPWSLGPIRLRKDEDELLQEKLKDAKGATIGFSDNRLVKGNGAWNSEGVLYYPVQKKLWDVAGSGSGRLETGPVVGWQLAETEDTKKEDIQELRFSLPTTFKWNIPNTSSARLLFQAKPYFNTDFSFEHEIYGVESSVEYVGKFLWSWGGYRNVGTLRWLQYQLRVIPKLDYSETAEGGEHTTRQEGDDWFRMGGKFSLDLRMVGKGFRTLEVGTSYELLETLSGSGGYSDLFKAHATWWLIENAGFTFKYSKGETPVATEEIDLITLGLELKF